MANLTRFRKYILDLMPSLLETDKTKKQQRERKEKGNERNKRRGNRDLECSFRLYIERRYLTHRSARGMAVALVDRGLTFSVPCLLQQRKVADRYLHLFRSVLHPPPPFLLRLVLRRRIRVAAGIRFEAGYNRGITFSLLRGEASHELFGIQTAIVAICLFRNKRRLSRLPPSTFPPLCFFLSTIVFSFLFFSFFLSSFFFLLLLFLYFFSLSFCFSVW